ncbi:MAG: cytochrome C oxidase subunit IV family protein [Bacteroidia bacterium]
MSETTHSLWYKVWRPFLILFVVTALEFLVAFLMPKGGIKVLTFVLMTIVKAFYITAYFMHMKFERISLAFIIIAPLILLIGLLAALAYEGHSILDILTGMK